ncbi:MULTISPECIES: hypothetical protein [unclassified Paenibacillus]|uniref:hypothetical protein n=1 Tax=unclassified Paenibacillus TaxID=185978 RepID=UPI0009571D21|nr:MULTISPECIES: hypothetical protein [unclassified Paenibacillus]ASS68858.1 hypothetical protein CIC07_24085 [Paenibacillus sp. RUD330]SIR17708.1 hypothetical protein SAMN05880555_3212 [Paenibacillus sp. RU4X]SIR21148.1 hypothetical protein SAMN05880570_2785 [Paenibacillus sp. RU4T]
MEEPNKNEEACREKGLPKDGTQGAVTIWACAASAALLLLMAVLIDYSRISSFRHKLEGLAQTGVRSVLSAYDETLYERYGLFGRGGTDGGALLAEAVQLGLDTGSGRNVPGDSIRLRWLDMEVSGSSVEPADFLGDHRIFGRQIMQEMKYKAPIDLTLELIDKFRPLSEAMGQTAATVDKLGSIEQAFDQRQQALENMLKLQKAAADYAVQSGHGALIGTGGSNGAGASGLQSIGAEYPLYLEWISLDEAATRAWQDAVAALPTPSPGATPSPCTAPNSCIAPSPLPPPLPHASEIADYENRAMAVSAKLQLAAEASGSHDSVLDEAVEQLEAARRAELEMKAVLDGRDEAGNSSYRLPAGSSAAADSIPGTVSVLDGASDMLLGEDWFSQAEKNVLEQRDDFRSFSSSAQAAAIGLHRALEERSVSWASRLSIHEQELSRQWRFYEDKWIAPGATMAEQAASIGNADSRKEERKAEKKKAAALWGEAQQLLNAIEGLKGTEEDLEAFRQAESLFKASMDFNRRLEEGGGSDEAGKAGGDKPSFEGVSGSTGADEAVKGSQKLAGGVFSGMGALLSQGGERLFTAQYAAQRFSFADPRMLDSLISGLSGSAGEPRRPDGEGARQDAHFPAMASLDNQEMEYILYGFNHPSGNLGAAYGELFAFRLAVRTMEGLIESRGAGHPLLVLAMAAVYGLREAIGDLRAILATGQAPISKYVPAELSYLDYLRLFYLLHGSEDSRLSRMIAIIELNTGTNLASVPAGATVEVKASMRLWFLTGAARLLGRSGPEHGAGGRYEWSTRAGWSY